MTAPEGRKIATLLLEGRALLESGRAGEAALVFERILLHEGDHPQARELLKEAREAVGEGERLLEEDAARLPSLAVPQSEPEDSTFDPVLVLAGPLPGPSRAPAPFGWSRAAFASACAVLFVLLGVAVASSWGGLIESLSRTPAPHSSALAPDSSLPDSTPASRALAEARRCLDMGEPAAALQALDGVSTGAPEHPFARQLRTQAEGMLAPAPDTLRSSR